VRAADISSDPRHPIRLEKNRNMGAVSPRPRRLHLNRLARAAGGR
jgi:hypothetical protein